jgi:hypothetical protein
MNQEGGEFLSMKKNESESGCNGCEATARLSNQKTRNGEIEKQVADSPRELRTTKKINQESRNLGTGFPR